VSSDILRNLAALPEPFDDWQTGEPERLGGGLSEPDRTLAVECQILPITIIALGPVSAHPVSADAASMRQ
jgi:hypothetical protein